jgi:tetratricopeptide (TPR) repeat protein
VACRPQRPDPGEDAAGAAMQQFRDVPLIQYRAGLCGGSAAAQLAAARDADPAFVDADLELGRRALQQRVPDVEEAIRRFQSAQAAFPDSPVMPVSIGSLRESREEWTAALAEYDATLALVPTHRDALLGRAIALSYLSRHEDAVASATRLLELGNWFVGQAHYWRAWNQYRLGRIEEARSDADLAKTLMATAPTFVLSGLIEWSRKRLEPAEAELQAALNMDFGQCEAASYLGGVRAERQQWPESRAAFVHAGQCFELSIVTRREAIASLSVTPAHAAANAVPIAVHQGAMAEAEMRRAEAARNIAAIDRNLASPEGR